MHSLQIFFAFFLSTERIHERKIKARTAASNTRPTTSSPTAKSLDLPPAATEVAAPVLKLWVFKGSSWYPAWLSNWCRSLWQVELVGGLPSLNMKTRVTARGHSIPVGSSSLPCGGRLSSMSYVSWFLCHPQLVHLGVFDCECEPLFVPPDVRMGGML